MATVSKEMEVLKDEDEYIDSFKPHLMGVVLEWAKGTSFVKITQMTNIYEGQCFFLVFVEPSDMRELNCHFILTIYEVLMKLVNLFEGCILCLFLYV